MVERVEKVEAALSVPLRATLLVTEISWGQRDAIRRTAATPPGHAALRIKRLTLLRPADSVTLHLKPDASPFGARLLLLSAG